MPFMMTPNGQLSSVPSSASFLEGEPLESLSTERLNEIARLIPAIGTLAFAKKYRHFKLEIPWFHRIWYDAYDDPNLDHVYVQAPREHAKTTTALTYATRRLAEDHHLRVGIVSGSDELAMKFLNEVKHELESNPEIAQDYAKCRRCNQYHLPEVDPANWSFRGEKWTDHELVLRDARLGENGISGKDVSLFSVGSGSQISSRHCDVLIIDDVESAKTVKSELMRQGTREWWSREVAPVLSPGGKMIVLGTRKHYDDLYAHLIGDPTIRGDDTTWKILDVAKSVWREDGSPIWPEFWDYERLMRRKKELDSTDILAWSQEYLNEPRPSETQMFYPDRWPLFGRTPAGLTVLQFWDLAISEKTSADWTVGWTIGVSEQMDVYLLERRRGHWDFNHTLSEIADMGAKWPLVQAIGIEQVAYQAAAVQEALRRTMLPIVPVTPDKDKVTRARLLEARAAARKVYRPAECDWWFEFATECVYFPAGAHDDQVDALSGAVRLAGWQADTISWAYGVWECRNPVCRHKFMFEPNRACPRCGTRAPETFENPELVGFGAMGEDRRDPADEIYDMIAGGRQVPDDRNWEIYRPVVQEVAQRLASEGLEQRAIFALNEVRRLDAVHGNGHVPGGF